MMVRKKSKVQVVFEIAVRVVLFACIGALTCFALGLLCGISASLLYGAIRHVHPDMTWAYKFVAAPFGVLGLVITFIAMLTNEIRRARRPRELSPATFHRTF